MNLKIRQLLDAIEDGEWHSMADLAEELKLRDSDVEKIVEFLGEFGLAEFDGDGRVKVDSDFRKLL